MRGQSTLQLWRASRFVWHSARGWTIASGCLILVQGLLPVVPLYLLKLVVDAVTAGLEASHGGAALTPVLFLVACLAAVTLFGALTRCVADVVGQAQSLAVTDHMSTVLHAKAIDVDLEYYDSARYYDTLQRAQREAPFRPTHIVTALVRMGQNALSLLAVAALLFLFNWMIASLLFAAVVPGVALQLAYAGRTYRWQRAQTSTERHASYLNWMLTDSSHAKEIRLFDLGLLFVSRVRDIRRALRAQRLRIAARRSFADFVGQTTAAVAMYGSFAFVAYQTLQRVITPGDLVMYFMAFQRGQGFLREILGSLSGLYEDSLFLSNLDEFLELKRTVIEPLHPRPVPQPMQTGIVFSDVSFQYPTGTAPVLANIHLTIRPGEVVALVGENGSGKTTLAKLLCRLYDPTDGHITLDGIDLRQFNTTALRREITALFQDYVQYHLTARENIWFGNIATPPDHERIAAAARGSGAADLIGALPHGYDTMLGTWFEDGRELSIGEWQKVALARAFLSDAQIIVLDEPTSSMDAEGEAAVFQHFRTLASGRMAILISHRFSTVRMADRIYVLEDGRIVEGGTHEELVSLGGLYAGLFHTQAQHYR